MCDPWVELDNIIRHQGDYAGVENEKTDLLHWKTRAEKAENEARTWKDKTLKLVEAVKEERELHEASYNDLLREKNSIEEKGVLLETKMIKLIEVVKSAKLSSGGSQISARSNNDNADLLLEMEKKLKDANQTAEQSKADLAQSNERCTLLESKLRQLAEVLKAEREVNHAKRTASDSQTVEIDLLKKRLAEATQREATQQQSSQASSVPDAEKQVKQLEDRLQKIALCVRKEREVKATEVNELKANNEKLMKTITTYQERLALLEKELQQQSSNGQDKERADEWKQKAEVADERARKAEQDAQEKISNYQARVKQILTHQEAKLKEQQSNLASVGSGISSSLASSSSEARVAEAEQRCRALEQRNRELEAASSSRASHAAHGPPPSGPPPPPPPAAAPPPPPPPAAVSATPASALMDAIRKGQPLKKAPTAAPTASGGSASGAGIKSKPKPSAGPNLAEMAAELANQRRQRMLNAGANNRGFRRSVRLDIMLEDALSTTK